MEPQQLIIYNENRVSLNGRIDEEGRLHLDSEVWGDYDSEAHYIFSKAETDLLFSIISLEDFIALCREEHLTGMIKFLKKHHITYDTFVI